MSRKRARAEAETATKRPTSRPPRLLGGQRLRVTVDDPTTALAQHLLIQPPDPESQWRSLKLDRNALDRLSPADLLERLVDLSPDISLALWNFLRLCNPGFEVRAYRIRAQTGAGALPNGAGSAQKEQVDPKAQAAVDAFLARLKTLYGSVDVIINRLFINAFMRGAFLAELVLDQAGRMPLDLATPDARWVYFRREVDPDRGQIWVPFQWQAGAQIDLVRPTIRYVPVDPRPSSPFGRAMATPALHTTLFLMGILHDLKRVVQQQGYPRLDISIDMKLLMEVMPPDKRGDPEEQERWLQSMVDDINAQYAALEPDDAWIHPNITTVNRPMGTVDASSLGGIHGLIEFLEREAMRSLKSTPLMMGLTGSSNETQSNRQYELFIQGIKALQHLGEGLLEYVLTLALQVQGIPARIEWRFAENRAAELLRDAQVASLQSQTALFQYQAGWLSQDEAALRGAGVEKADQPEPRAVPAAFSLSGSKVTEPGSVQADPGSQKSTALSGVRGEEPAANGRHQ